MRHIRDVDWGRDVLVPIATMVAVGTGWLVLLALGLVLFVLVFGGLGEIFFDAPSLPAEVNEAREAEADCDPAGGGMTVAPSISSDYWGAGC